MSQQQIEAPWAKIPITVIQDTQLKRADLLVYWYLDYRCGKIGQWFGGQKQIAEALGLKLRTVERAITKLTERGYILKHRQGMQRMTRNLYYVLARTTEVPRLSKRTDAVGGSVPTQLADPKTQTTDTEDL